MAATASGRRERTTATTASNQEDASQSKPREDDIRILAYHLYERRHAEGIGGDATSDWIEAERRLGDSEPREQQR